MTLRKMLLIVIIGAILVGCGDGYERGTLPIIKFSTVQVTDTSATLRLDIVDKGTYIYPSTGGMKVVLSEQPISSDWSFLQESDYLTNKITDGFYEVTIEDLDSSTVYYANTYYQLYEWTGGGDILFDVGKENFSFTTLPN